VTVPVPLGLSISYLTRKDVKLHIGLLRAGREADEAQAQFGSFYRFN
jgi:hypothetical protein